MNTILVADALNHSLVNPCQGLRTVEKDAARFLYLNIDVGLFLVQTDTASLQLVRQFELLLVSLLSVQHH